MGSVTPVTVTNDPVTSRIGVSYTARVFGEWVGSFPQDEPSGITNFSFTNAIKDLLDNTVKVP
jgi:glutamate mutase epsilon subunit